MRMEGGQKERLIKSHLDALLQDLDLPLKGGRKPH